MSCRICKRGGCTESFHSLEEQERFERGADDRDDEITALKEQLADLTRDYTGACEAIRQLEANVAAYKARYEDVRRAVSAQNEEVCQILGKALGYPWFKDDQKNWPGATERDGVCVGDHVAESLADEAAARLTAAEAASEAVLASLAAAEAVAGEVRGEAAKAVCHYCRVGAPFVETPYGRNGRWHQNDVDPLVCSWCSASAIHAIPTPSAALQRVREQEAERALRWAWYEVGPGDPRDEGGVDPGRDELVAEGMAMLFPTPDAEGK